MGEYIYPFKNQKLNTDIYFNDIHSLEKTMLQTLIHYNEIDLELIHQNESLGSKNYTFQIFFQNIPIEQAWLKIHFSKRNQQVLLAQSNLPSHEIWNNFYLNNENNNSNNLVLLIKGEEIELAHKQQIEEEKTDTYAQQFILESGQFYENSIKYHIDTTAHVKVFLPDPLTTANQVYGGNYQDAFTKDTTALLIQNIINPGGNTITANSTNYTFDGQNFNINTESYINNFTANNLFHVFENIYIDGQGNVLGYNATITDNLASYTSQIIQEDYNYPELAAQQIWQVMPVDYSSSEFKLQNDFFIISEFSAPVTNATVSPIDTFNFTRNQLEFEDINAFFHLNNFKSHWESLGFTNLANQVILVDAHGNNGADNSFFTPTAPPKLIFGQGGVDDAEDADVIVHEYGHAISNFAAPNSNTGSLRKALDEGFGDYLASSYSKQFNTHNWFHVFTWDGHNDFFAGRFSNSTKTAQDININQNIYYNAEIWSSTLMDLYFKIGADNTDKLAIEIMHYNMPNTTLTQAAINLFTADTAIFNGHYSCDIFEVLEARKFITGTCQDYISGIKNYNQNEDGVLLNNTLGFTNNSGNLSIEIKEDDFKNGIYSIIDLNGAIILSDEFNDTYLDLTDIELSSGIYFLEVETNNNLYSFKILKN